MNRKLIYISFPILFIIILISYYPIQTLYIITKTWFLAYLGLSICAILSSLGGIIGLKTISNSLSGTSILVPELKNKAFVCLIFCEGSLIIAFITTMTFLNQMNNNKKDISFICGMFLYTTLMGVLSFLGSYNVGEITAAVLITEGKRRGYFMKLLFPILIGGTFGLMGLAFGLTLVSQFSDAKYNAKLIIKEE